MNKVQSISIFQRLTRDEISQLEKIARKEQIPAERAVFFEGDRSEDFYIILSGSVRVYKTALEGEEKILNTLGAGDFFGEMAMIDGATRSASVTANEETVLLAIEQRKFKQFCTQNPLVLWKVLEEMSHRMRQVMGDLFAMSFRDVPYRLLRVLSTLVKKHGEKRLDGLRIGIHLNPRLLAGMVGSSADRVAQVMTRFTEEGLLRREGDYLLVLDPVALERTLQAEGDWA